MRELRDWSSAITVHHADKKIQFQRYTHVLVLQWRQTDFGRGGAKFYLEHRRRPELSQL